MAMNFDIPDITENGEKAAAGGQRRKPRRIGALRLGDTLRAVSRHYTATLENKDEDKEAEFYSLSEGEEKASFYGMDVSVTGICIRKKKVAAIYVEMLTKDRDDFIKKLEEAEGSAEHANNMDIFADTVTSIFITIPAKGDSSFTTALMDSAEVKALSDNEAIKAEEEAKKGGLRHRIWKTYFDPVGRISRKAYLPKMLMVGAPAAFLFALTCFKPELFVGETNFFIAAFLILGTLCFISLISLGMRRLSDIGKSHLYYWAFFALLFIIHQAGEEFLGSQLNATRLIAVIFMLVVILLAFIPGDPKRNKYGPVPKE